MPNQWLPTDANTTRTNGTGTNRTITQSGLTTTLRQVPLITRTITKNAVAVSTVTNEDEGFTMSFTVKIRDLIGTVPPNNPSSLQDANGNIITDASGAAILG